jgi:hypothetical protein
MTQMLHAREIIPERLGIMPSISTLISVINLDFSVTHLARVVLRVIRKLWELLREQAQKVAHSQL